MSRWLHSLLAFALPGALLLAVPTAGAAPLHSGNVTGTFLAPRLAGGVVNTDGSPVALDNYAWAGRS